MAAPSIRGSTAPAATMSPTSPAGTEVGDMVIVFSWTRGGAGVPTHTLQGGFTQIINHGHDDGSTDGRLSAAYKIAESAGANTYGAYTSSGGDNWSGILVLTTGTFRTTGIVSNSVTQTNTAAPNPAALTTLTAALDYLVIVCSAWHLGSVDTAVTAPTNYTEQWEISGTQTSELSCATRDMTDAGVTIEDPGSFSDNQTPAGTCSLTIAIAEVAPSGPPAGLRTLTLTGCGV